MTDVARAKAPTMNKLLGAIDAAAFARLSPALDHVHIEHKQVLYRPGEKIRHVYFPESGVLVLVTVMENGASIESATVGREGATWISAISGAPTMPCQTMVAIDGVAFKLPVEALEAEVNRNRDLRDTLSHYSHALLIDTLRSTACNGLHTIEQRLARWILTTLDRIEPEGRFAITHEFLGYLLGTARPTVTVTVNDLMDAGYLESQRGLITVANRDGLERIVCECYGVIRENFRNLLAKPR